MRKIHSTVRANSRSREKLRSAAVALLDERNPADITVTELVAAAGVSRPTFYAAYDDLPSAWADATTLRLEEAFADLDPEARGFVSGDIDAIVETIGQAVERLEPHIDFFHRALTGPGSPEILRQSIDFLAARILAAQPLGSLLDEGPLDPKVSAQAVAASVVWTAARWVGDDRDAVGDAIGDAGGDPDGVRSSREGLVRDLAILLVRGIDGGLGGRR